MKKVNFIIFNIFMFLFLFLFNFFEINNFSTKNLNKNTQKNGWPTSAFSSYIYFYEKDEIYDFEKDSVDIYNIDRDADIYLDYVYYINKEEYDLFKDWKGENSLDHINFYLTDSKEGFLYKDKKWSYEINYDDLIFDIEKKGTMKISNHLFKDFLNKKIDDYVLKIIWGNDENDLNNQSAFTFGNRDIIYGAYKPIYLHFNSVTDFYEPKIWFYNDDRISYRYLKKGASIDFSFDLPYKTFVSKVNLIVEDIEDHSFKKIYDIKDKLSAQVNYLNHHSSFYFSYNDYLSDEIYKDRSALSFWVEIEWYTLNEEDEIINEGKTSTIDYDDGTGKKIFYFQDLYSNIYLENYILEPEQKTLKIFYEYQANRNDVSFFTNEINIYFKNLNNNQLLKINLVDVWEEDYTFDLGNNNSGIIEINLNNPFFVEKNIYEFYIKIEDLRYEHWAFNSFPYETKKTYFSINDWKLDYEEVENQKLNIEFENNLKYEYGDNIKINYQFQNFTNPWFVEYKIIFKQNNKYFLIREETLKNKILDCGEIEISFNEYKDIINSRDYSEIFISYKVKENRFVNNNDSNAYTNENNIILLGKEESKNSYFKFLIWFIIISLLIILLSKILNKK